MTARSSRTEEESLRLFIERVDQAFARRAIVNGTLAAKFSLEFKNEESKFSIDTGDEEDFRSLLLDFRSFLSPKEDVHANRIFNIIEQRTQDPELREANRHNRAQWRAACQGPISMVMDERTFTAEQGLDLYVNGEIFHQDAEKAAVLESMPDVMRALLRQQSVSFVMNGLETLWATHNVALAVLDRR